MASLGHIVVGMAAARVDRSDRSRRPTAAAMALWAGLALLPDADVIGFSFGVDYGDPWGHRGATHSLVFALALAPLAGIIASGFGRRFGRSTLLAALVLASHGLLDTLTDGGLGAALFWPFDLTRYFAAWNPIPVAPIGWSFFSPYGLMVSLVELVLFAPLLWFALRREPIGPARRPRA
jgi:inner membrane protein